jgi:asparagine synthase (glutamine-hydrolysing)
MCGISALISPTGQFLNKIESMNNVIKHRGPDDEGFYVYSIDNKRAESLGGASTPKDVFDFHSMKRVTGEYKQQVQLAFGHRRLSIRDTSSRGHQPMLSECGRYTIVYNGEIYAIEDMRNELIVLGYQFNSNSDTEVLLAGYAEWKELVLERLNGMFSFIVFDSKLEEVFIARDRFGIKPLYYWYSEDNGLAIASEIKQFTVLDGWCAELNGPRAYDFLNWGQTDHTVETMFRKVFHVPPGHFCRFSLRNIPSTPAFECWYKIKSYEYDSTFEQASKDFEELFVDAVSIRLKADVPIGTCLSGGLDSSSIVCVVNKLLNGEQEQKTFSSCSEHPKFDEREFVYEVLNKTNNVDSCLFELQHDQFADKISKLIYQQDEPFLSPSVFAEWSVFKNVKEAGVKVTLDGHGADEQLIGYHTFYGSHLFSLFKTLKWIKLFKEMLALRNLHGYGIGYSLRKILRGVLPNSINQLLFKMTARPTTKVDWLDTYKLNIDKTQDDFDSNILSISELSIEQLTKTSLPKQLRWCDRDSMAHSIESRVPFLDYRIVEFLSSIPESYKLDAGITKRILRESMKSYLPEKVTNRIDKMGFVTPAELWVKSDSEQYKLIIKQIIKKSNGILNCEAEKRFTDMIDGKLNFDHSFWRAIFFAEWVDVYKVKV